ncbi:sensor histidine kinase [Zobellia laminariae]|uniref:sensor histidine kinase n=1 Tax=Zobellia laminariae TaxID=248906 RepID=UPI003EF5B69A
MPPHSQPPLHNGNGPTENYFFRIISFNHGIVFQFIAIWLLSLFLKLDERLKIAYNQQLMAEVNYLKAKVNPHFLFNTLNNIYSLTLVKSEVAPDAVLRLSNLMRYVVTECENKKVLLSKELEHIENFVALQKLRLSEKNTLSFTVNGTFKNQLIAPIILINYIENAFKYGVNPETMSEIDIKVQINGNDLTLIVKNHIVVNRGTSANSSTKEGMQNSLKRLDILYPNKYKLKVDDTGTMYTCTLQIDLS